MKIKEQLIADILSIEWKMFEQIQNIDRKAPCQENPNAFYFYRRSQFSCWSEAVLQCYLADLQLAAMSGRNLVWEKYARMMESTDPASFDKVKHRLCPIPPQQLAMIEAIVSRQLVWTQEANAQFKEVLRDTRALKTDADTQYETSFETYLRAELKTYSKETRQKLAQYLQQLTEENRNLSAEIWRNQIGGSVSSAGG